MKLGEFFPSAYLKASDIGDREVTVKIANVEMVEIGMGNDKKVMPNVSFVGKTKTMLMNKTNLNTLALLYFPGRSLDAIDHEELIGKSITLITREVEFEGKVAPALRISSKKPKPVKPLAEEFGEAPDPGEDDLPSIPSDPF